MLSVDEELSELDLSGTKDLVVPEIISFDLEKLKRDAIPNSNVKTVRDRLR